MMPRASIEANDVAVDLDVVIGGSVPSGSEHGPKQIAFGEAGDFLAWLRSGRYDSAANTVRAQGAE